MIRTRVAPSPTGFPHIGTIYQSLFDFAFAHKNNGKFVVRIEDTDRTRFVEGAEDGIFAALDWFGLSEDESPRKAGEYGPYRQSERLPLYKKHAEELVEKGHAYYCFCSKERLTEIRQKMQDEKQIPKYDRYCRTISLPDAQKRLENGESYVIRMKIPDGETIIVHDGIRGEIVFESDILDDQVIIKADGFPTYHLAVVVDDHEMQISHVLRGEEWISSAPKHVLLYRYFGWQEPLWFHTPLIRNPDKSKLSKRQGHTAVTWYQQEGYLPQAIKNYLALMGWSHPEGKDIFSLDEFIRLFEFKDLKPLGPIFDLVKLSWMNGQYIMQMPDEILADHIMKYFSEKNLDASIVRKSIPLIKERIKTLKEYWPLASFLFEKPTEYDQEITETQLLSKVASSLEKIDSWTATSIGESLQALATQEHVQFGKFFMMMRIVISGHKVSPPLNESLEILGKEECMARIQALI